MKRRILLSLFGALPVTLMGFSTGPPTKRTGEQADGAQSCTACHRTFAPANSDARGALKVDAANYVPGVKQTIRVTVTHPEAVRWGFELTARLASDETKTAGELAGAGPVKVMCDDGSLRGAAAPCQAGQLQFAMHADAPRTDAGAGFTFTVDWTPPATSVGDVVFYAAANAANGDSTNANDRIYTAVRRVSAPCALTQKPAILSAVNGASFQAPWSAGTMMSIFGSGFGASGTTRPATLGDIVDRKFPQNLGCIAVTINGQPAPITYVQPNQINLQAPTLAGIGPASIVVIANPGATNEIRSDAVSVATQQAFAPALFTFNGRTAVATSPDGRSVYADPAVFSAGVPAKPGDTVVLYATGLGVTNPVVAPGDVVSSAARLTSEVAITVGGQLVPAADVLYAGLSPQSISGLDQINLKLPAGLPDGDATILLSVGGAQSPSGISIPVRR